MAHDSGDWLAYITCPAWKGGRLVLKTDWTFEAEGKVPAGVLASAQVEAATYEYSTSHGDKPGFLAATVANGIKGARVEYPPVEEDPPGTVY